MSLLEMKHIKKSFNGVEVLKDISLTVEKGEVLGIIGPSGSGKSTLLRCATGLETQDEGLITYEGTFGLVFQNFNLFPHYSVLKNITDAPIKVQKRKKEEVYREARELLGIVQQGKCLSLSVVGRTAAARIHCAGAGYEAGYPVF